MGALTDTRPGATGATREDICAALALAELPGLGPRRARLLIDHFGSASRAVTACRRGDAGLAFASGRKIPGTSTRLMERLRGVEPAPPERPGQLEERGIRMLVYSTPEYPSRLCHLHDPPTLLYARGRLSLLGTAGVAIVGTRRATSYGRRMARDIARGIVLQGRTVISGMARGIDGAAHRAALDARGGSIGVLGCGLDRVYPAEHRDLYGRMGRRGLLVSEFSPDRAPMPGFFPRRNRIIAALAHAVVVVQAGRRSGALITAGHALDIGRDVFAVPGPVGPAASLGVHRLLRDGAELAAGAEDIARALGWEAPDSSARPAVTAAPGRTQSTTHWSTRLLARLQEGPASSDELAGIGRRPIAETLALLGRWEIEGRVLRQSGGRFELAAASTDPPREGRGRGR